MLLNLKKSWFFKNPGKMVAERLTIFKKIRYFYAKINFAYMQIIFLFISFKMSIKICDFSLN